MEPVFFECGLDLWSGMALLSVAGLLAASVLLPAESRWSRYAFWRSRDSRPVVS